MNVLMNLLVILLGAVICRGHVHIMEPHDDPLEVKANEPITIKCESQADRDITWSFNHRPLLSSEHVNITEYHRADHSTHKDHDHDHAGGDGDGDHKHPHDDDIDKLAHEHDEHHNHGHDDDDHHDHSKEGNHNPSGEHAGHHRESVLYIAHAKASDAGTYGCNEAGDKHDEEHIDVTVDGKWGAERLVVQHDSTENVVVGNMIHLVCSYYGTDTSATISWQKDGKALPSSADFIIKELNKPYGKKGALHKHAAARTDFGEYSCAAGTLSEKIKVTAKVARVNSSSIMRISALFILLALLTTTLL